MSYGDILIPLGITAICCKGFLQENMMPCLLSNGPTEALQYIDEIADYADY